MFFNHKSKNKNKINQIQCNSSNNLTECSTVAKIKQYQEELNKLHLHKNASQTIGEYFVMCRFDSQSHYAMTRTIESLKQSKTNCEEYFRDFGQKLDICFQEEKIIEELKNNIQTEKERLGIN